MTQDEMLQMCGVVLPQPQFDDSAAIFAVILTILRFCCDLDDFQPRQRRRCPRHLRNHSRRVGRIGPGAGSRRGNRNGQNGPRSFPQSVYPDQDPVRLRLGTRASAARGRHEQVSQRPQQGRVKLSASCQEERRTGEQEPKL